MRLFHSFALAAGAVLLSSFAAVASPVTFNITGIVDSSSTLPGFVLGQTVVGQVTLDLSLATTQTGSNYIQYDGAIMSMQIANFTAPATGRNIIVVQDSPTYDQIVIGRDASAIAHVPIFYFQFSDSGPAPRNALTDLSTSWTSGIDPTKFNFANITYIPDFQNWFNDHVQLSATITSVEVASGVPEPSTWAMMLLGFAGVGYLSYRRCRQTIILSAV